jgi:hypothetical protein
VLPPDRLEDELHNIVATASASKGSQTIHRALADAIGEYETWLRAGEAARELISNIVVSNDARGSSMQSDN